MIHHITTDELKDMVSTEGLVLQGCGGDSAEWQEGINKMLTEADIFRNGGEFKDIYVFENNGVTNILYPFDSLAPDTLDIGKLAVWRLQNHDNFVGTWLSDYLTNALGLNLDAHEVNHEPVGNHPLNIYIEKWLVLPNQVNIRQYLSGGLSAYNINNDKPNKTF